MSNTTNDTSFPLKPTCLIYDLDGLVVDSSARLRSYVDHSAQSKGDFETYYTGLYHWSQTTEGDEPIAAGIVLVQSLINHLRPDRVLALTARGEEGRTPTLAWMQQNLPWNPCSEDLIMGEGRFPDASGRVYNSLARNLHAVEHKHEKILLLQSQYRILFALDDHPGICKMYQDMGVPTLQALWPNIDCLTPAGDTYAPARQ